MVHSQPKKPSDAPVLSDTEHPQPTEDDPYCRLMHFRVDDHQMTPEIIKDQGMTRLVSSWYDKSPLSQSLQSTSGPKDI